jgi:hypothetical protein
MMTARANIIASPLVHPLSLARRIGGRSDILFGPAEACVTARRIEPGTRIELDRA